VTARDTAGAAEQLLARAYAAYNRQDLDGLLALVSDDVDWPDGSHRLRGRAAVTAYWTQQWTRVRTHDRPVRFTHRPDGTVTVRISQVVRSLAGEVVSTGSFDHVHRIEDSRIVRLDIRDAPSGSASGGD
jgi:ketosteroid isomerase-like protein